MWHTHTHYRLKYVGGDHQFFLIAFNFYIYLFLSTLFSLFLLELLVHEKECFLNNLPKFQMYVVDFFQENFS